MKNDKVISTFREKGLKLCKEKLKNFPHLTLVESTFVTMAEPALFIHAEYGEWLAIPSLVLGPRKMQHPNSYKVSAEELKNRIHNGYNGIPPRPYITFDDKDYINMSTKMKFVDEVYGEWLAIPNNVSKGEGHKKRFVDSTKRSSIDVENEIKKTRPYISIDHSTYINTNTKCTFIDSEFGCWEAKPSRVLLGTGHPKRALNNLRISVDEVQRRIVEGTSKIEPRNYISIKKETYIDISKKAIFIDNIYGEFEAFVYTILNGVDHIKRTKKYEWSEKFIEEMLKNRPIKINYSTYTSDSAIFIDEKYGIWEAKPYDVIIKGTNHPKRSSDSNIVPYDEVLYKIQNGHGNVEPMPYVTLVKETYVDSRTKATFIDDIYGTWITTPNSVLCGHKHPIRAYKSTRLEDTISESLNIKKNFSKIGNTIPDFIIGDVIVECDGLYWHSELKKDKYHHYNRRENLEKLGYRVFQFRSDEINNKLAIVLSIINNAIGKSKRIFARKTEAKIIEAKVARKFFDCNHLMGGTNHKAIALYVNNEIVAAMSFYFSGNDLHIGRFCNKLNHNVIGAYSKLIKCIEYNTKCKRIINFVDLRYGSGKHLLSKGFNFCGITLGWKWTDGETTYNRLKCRANMDDRKLSEREHADELGWYKIYDAGQAKFIKELQYER